jgi:hypothetical protein
MIKTVSAAVIGASLLIAFWSLSGSAADDKLREEPTIDFAGKVVMLTPTSSNALANENVAEVLESPTIQKVGGKMFFVGAAKAASDDEKFDWRKGTRVGVAVNQVESFYVYTPEQYDEMQKTMAADETE